MDLKLIEQINELLLNGRTQLKKEAAADVKNKLIAKRENLKENFIVNLPSNYNNEKELFELFVRIENLKTTLLKLKSENVLLSTSLAKKKSENNSKHNVSNELNSLVFKSIHLKRQLCYTSCLIKIEEIKLMLEANLTELDQSLKKKLEKPSSNDKRNEKHELHLHLIEQNNLFETTISNYLQLKSMLAAISSTKCTSLLRYLIDSIEIYHDKLKSILTK